MKRNLQLPAATLALAVATWCPLQTIFAQDAPAASESAKPHVMAKDADPDWDVVSVRPSDPNATGGTFDVRGRHVIVGNRTVETMLRLAYGVMPSQIVGAPTG